VAYRPLGAAAILRRNLLIYGAGGIVIPFIGIKIIDVLINACISSNAMKTLLSELKTSLVLTIVLAVLLCGAYPVAVWAGAQLLFPRQRAAA